MSSPLRLPFSRRKNGSEVGFPEYIVGCEEDGRYFCTMTEATAEDEGSWECLLDDGSGDGPLCSFCVVKVLIPKHFKVGLRIPKQIARSFGRLYQIPIQLYPCS